MKHCYNNEIFMVSAFALIILIYVALQPYMYHAEAFAELDGEDINNHSCPKLMMNSVYLKNHYKGFNKNAKTVASFMEPGLSEQYMETDSKQYLKGMCVIPDNKIISYNLKLQDDPVKGGPSQICKASFENKKTNGITEVVMPYVRDVNSGCALVFSEYGNDPKKVEEVLSNLYILSDEYNEQVKQKNLEQKNSKKNEYNTYNNTDKQLNNVKDKYNGMNSRLVSKTSREQEQLNMTNAVNYQLRQQNQQLKNKVTSTW